MSGVDDLIAELELARRCIRLYKQAQRVPATSYPQVWKHNPTIPRVAASMLVSAITAQEQRVTLLTEELERQLRQ